MDQSPTPQSSWGTLNIVYPFRGTLFPPEISAPTVHWLDDSLRADAWAIRFDFASGEPLDFESESPDWAPSETDWAQIKARSTAAPARITVVGVERAHQDVILSAGETEIRTSSDPVRGSIFYREVNLPFRDAVKDPSRIRWRFGDIASTQQPPIILEKLPVCGNCHSFSKDGATLGMDVDYANDKGSYAILPVDRQEVLLEPNNIISWSDYRRNEGDPTFGLLSAVSPDGRYVVSTVKDESVFVALDKLEYSQLFFPIKGILAVYDRKTSRFFSLPGADDPDYVQSNATWSPDGKYLVFARSMKYQLRRSGKNRSNNGLLLSQDDCREFLKEGKKFLFDLYRIPFNDGKGGRAEPLRGASGNGMSNYFAKYSPDGRWIVFCRAGSFMLLQPDSELWIVPAAGGEARRLDCNLPGMNSWHSWSPNGRWLVFSSKAFTPYTQLFLAHIDAEGRSAPPALLSRFTVPDWAANIPEFVDLKPDAIQSIKEKFLDDHNYARIARRNLLSNDVEAAEAAARQALAINPESAEALCNLGVVMRRRGRLNEAIELFGRSRNAEPNNADIRFHLANALSSADRLEEAITEYQATLRLNPEMFSAQIMLGRDLMRLGRYKDATVQLSKAVQKRPDDAGAAVDLGMAYRRQGLFAEAAEQYQGVLKRQPDQVDALIGLSLVRAMADKSSLRDPTDAILLAQKACELTKFQNAEALATLAKVYGESRRYREATRAAGFALDAARREGNVQMVRTAQAMVEYYQRRQQQSRFNVQE